MPRRSGSRLAMIYSSLAVVLTTATANLWRYQLSVRWRGPSPDRAVAMLGQWSRRMWTYLRLNVQIDGQRPAEPRIYVANHRSYLDVPVLAGVLEATFLSRADVATWPFIGATARAIGAVFVERDDPHERIRAARALVRRVRSASVVAFPEGTTGGERLPAPFHLGLFRLAQRLGVPLVPVTLRYSDRRAYWTEDLTLWQHLRGRVYGGAPLVCAVHIGRELPVRLHADGASLARAAHAAVCAPIEEFGELV